MFNLPRGLTPFPSSVGRSLNATSVVPVYQPDGSYALAGPPGFADSLAGASAARPRGGSPFSLSGLLAPGRSFLRWYDANPFVHGTKAIATVSAGVTASCAAALALLPLTDNDGVASGLSVGLGLGIGMLITCPAWAMFAAIIQEAVRSPPPVPQAQAEAEEPPPPFYSNVRDFHPARSDEDRQPHVPLATMV